MTKLYSIGTWDQELQAYTPQAGMTTRWYNITIRTLRHAIRDLRRLGYPAYRTRDRNGDRDSDPCVVIERTDGLPVSEIKKRWER